MLVKILDNPLRNGKNAFFSHIRKHIDKFIYQFYISVYNGSVKMKKCIVCGRNIKSGYKYCWQHRNTRPDNYGLPSARTRKNYHTESSNYTIFFGICLIIPSLLAIFLIGDGGLKFIGFVFLLLGIWVFRTGTGHRKDIDKILIKDKIRAKMDRDDLYKEAREEVVKSRKKKGVFD